MNPSILPEGYDPDSVALTFDVEWAHDEIIADTVALLDERGLVGTFFVTHAGVDVPGHERALHPNFRRNGDLYRSIPNASALKDDELFDSIVRGARAFAPEAKGVRSHSLLFDTALLKIYRAQGLEYDATLRLELAEHLRPGWKQAGIVEIPTYYADYFDMDAQATSWLAAGLKLGVPGLKVFDFHPVLIFTNAPDVPFYDGLRPIYRDVERLRAARFSGRGTRSLFIALLDELVRMRTTVVTTGTINQLWRTGVPVW